MIRDRIRRTRFRAWLFFSGSFWDFLFCFFFEILTKLRNETRDESRRSIKRRRIVIEGKEEKAQNVVPKPISISNVLNEVGIINFSKQLYSVQWNTDQWRMIQNHIVQRKEDKWLLVDSLHKFKERGQNLYTNDVQKIRPSFWSISEFCSGNNKVSALNDVVFVR